MKIIILQTLHKKSSLLGMVAVAMLLGVVGGSMLQVTKSDAQTVTAAVTPQTQPSQKTGDFDPAKGGHRGANGKVEELLTGDTAEKVKAAALKAVPGATIQRVETDAEGYAYEAHLLKSDGTRLTVKFDSNFTVTKTETGNNGPHTN